MSDMSTPLSEDVRTLLRRPNPAVMASVRPDGQPVTVATWYLLEDDDTISFTLDGGRKRLDYLRAEPRVSLTALAEDNWYTQVSVQGRVTAIVDDIDLAATDRHSRHYGGQPYPNRDRPRVVATMTIDRVASWNLG